MGKVNITTVGCKVNQAESDELRLGLLEAGHDLCDDPGGSDLCVVNTCAVTAESERKCRKLIRGLGRKGAGAIVAAGCYVQVEPFLLSRLPGVVEIIPNSQKGDWVRRINAMLPEGAKGGRDLVLERARGFIKVQDGCDRCCSYCIVPRARGEERSRSVNGIMRCAERYLELGTEELVLCGINLGRYKDGNGLDLAGLVEELSSLGKGFRVRLSSIELEDLEPSWLEGWAGSGRVCPHLHLPLQSGDENILKDMGRGYLPQDFIAAARALRSAWPQAALTTEVIVGYPGESEEAFQATVGVLEAVRPSRLHVFRFSPRPGTPAGSRRDRVPDAVVEERSQRLRDLGRKWEKDRIRERLGGACRFLVERIAEDGNRLIARGTTEDYIKALMEDPPPGARVGHVLEAEVRGLIGEQALLEPEERGGGRCSV